MSLRTAMIAYAAKNPDADEQELAAGFVKGHSRGQLVELLASEFIRLRRVRTTVVESGVLDRLKSKAGIGKKHTAAEVSAVVAELVPLMHERYRIGDGEPRLGADMTLSDWRTRRAMLQAKANGIQRAIEVCDRAISVLERTGAHTLGELQTKKAA